MKIRIRKAKSSDVPILQELIHRSVRELQKEDYTPEQMEGALQTVFGVDSQLIADGTYLVAEADAQAAAAVGKPAIAGCGGWSKRRTLYGGDAWTAREDSLLDPATDAAKIRAFFVDPAWARKGVGSAILQTCEAAARKAGFKRYEMGATLTGVKLFQAKGYKPLRRIAIALENGEALPVIHMEKTVE